MRLSIASTVACLLASVAQSAESSAAIRKFDLNIPRQTLDAALKDLAQQTGFQIARMSDMVDGTALVGPISGSLTAEEALKAMLKAQSLSYKVVNDNTIAIVNPEPEPVSTIRKSRVDLAKTSFRVAQAASSQSSASTVLGEGARSADDASRNRNGSSPTHLEEIVVTAQKREERLQDVPISISVLGGAALERPEVQSVSDALSRVPGISVNISNIGGGTQLSMRGAATDGANFRGSSTVAYYMDGVPFGLVRSAALPDSNIYDLERVEVLRGPQGTLYGASALNGVVRILAKKAELNAFEFKARTTVSSTRGAGALNYGGDMAVNAPIVDGKLAARLAGSYSNLSGWIDTPSTDNANGADLRSIRLQLAAAPIDNLALDISAWLSRANRDGRDVGNDDDKVSLVAREPLSDDYDVYKIEAGYEFPGISLSSTTSYLNYDNVSRRLANAALANVAGNMLDTDLQSRILTEELLLKSTNQGSWRWSLGAFYRDAKESTWQELPALIPAPQAWTDTTRSWALFGEVSRKFLDGKLEWTVGLRRFHDVIKMQQDIDLFGTGVLTASQREYNATTPRIVLTAFPGNDVTAYASYSEGFRSGFPQLFTILRAAPGFPDTKPDKLRNYEIGAKGELLNRRISFDAALYYMDWRDVQQAIAFIYQGICCFNAPINAGSASGLGVDLSVAARPAAALEVGVSLSANDLGFDDGVVSGANNVELFSRGDRLNLSPKYTANAFADVIGSFGNGYSYRLSLSANYVSPQRVSRLNSTQTAVTTITGDSMLLGRASIAIEASANWSATLFVNNLGDTRNVPTIDTTTNEGDRVRPRTIGLQIGYKY